MKTKVRSKANATIFNDKPSSDNVLRIRKCSGVKPFKLYWLQNHSAFRGKFKAKHRSFLLLRWRTGGRDKLAQVNSVSNPIGSSNEGLHERLEVMLLGIGHLDGRQLVLSRIFAVNTYQGQSNISTTPGGRLLPFLHSIWNVIQSSP